MRSSCTRRPRTSSSTSAETGFHGRVGDPSGSGHGRGPLVIGAWVLGLATVVAIAAVNGGPGSSDGRVSGNAIALASPAATLTAVPATSRPTARSLVLDEPARSGVVVTTEELIVRGRVAAGAGEVRIMLESSGGKPLATAALDPTGHPRAGFVPFEATFRLSKPRPGGSMMLFVVAVDGAGLPIDGIRRRFTVGAVVEVPERTVAPAD